jgi:dTDP-4-dehydrorhamnose reductase
MRIVITGGIGQLGRALQKSLSTHDLVITDLPETDITDRAAIEGIIQRAQADFVIHCAAYTDVDESARNPELAYRINALGTQNVVLACEKIGAELVHISTNEVFAGDRVQGYQEWMPLDPVNAYGRSKAMAETFVRNHATRYSIVRTAWLYGPGGRNFIHAIIAKAKSEGEVRVVADEVANPTYVLDLAEVISQLIESGQQGTYHFVNEGSCSRWAFAEEILRQAGLDQVKIAPILSREYRRASSPPPFAALHNIAGAAIGITLRPWEDALQAYMDVHAAAAD